MMKKQIAQRLRVLTRPQTGLYRLMMCRCLHMPLPGVRFRFRKDQSWLQVVGRMQPIGCNRCHSKPPFFRDGSDRVFDEALLDKHKQKNWTVKNEYKQQGNNKNKKHIRSRGQKARIENGKSQDTLSPYSNSGDHQFIPLKFRRLMNTSPKDRIWGYGGGPPTDQKKVATKFGQLAANFRLKWI